MPLMYPPSRAATVFEATLAAVASSGEGRRTALPLSPALRGLGDVVRAVPEAANREDAYAELDLAEVILRG